MALDDVVKGIVVRGEGGKPKVATPYNPEAILNATNTIRQLQGFNVASPQGIAEYSTLTGHEMGGYSQREIGKRRDADVAKMNGLLGEYGNTHFSSMTHTLGEGELVTLGLSYVPKDELEEMSEGYKAARGIIASSVDELETINNNPEAFIKGLIEGAGYELGRLSLVEAAPEIMQIRVEQARKNMQLAIIKYGPREFVVDTHKALSVGPVKIAEARTAYAKALNLKERELGKVLDGSEEAQHLQSQRLDLESAIERYRSMDPSGLVSNTIDFVDQVVRRNKANAGN